MTADASAVDDGLLGVGATRVVSLREIVADNGNLLVGEVPGTLPFVVRRFFALYAIPAGEARGTHAHRECEQFLVCLRGSVTALVDDGRASREVRLDRPDLGLYMPRLTWGTQSDYSSDALLLVFASHPYDADDYIHDYDEFRSLAGA
jgi:UDP-2-acetamido-3-amino-2,3-dideoxy-glucuronate N-acetyltransferase